MNTKLRDAKNLIKSKCYILITDKEGVMAGDFKGLDGLMKIHSLQLMHDNTEKLINKLKGREDKKHGRNARGRTRSRKSN